MDLLIKKKKGSMWNLRFWKSNGNDKVINI